MSHTIRVYGDIGEGYYSEGISAEQYASALDAVPLDEKAVDIRINSFGGLTSDGLAMMNITRSFSQKRKGIHNDFKITAHIDGYAFSAASIFPLAADEVVMHEGTLMMIHNAWMGASGDYRDMQAAADYLKKVSQQLAGLYAAKTGLKEDAIAKLMDDETFFTPAEAKALKMATVTSADAPPSDAKALYARLNFQPTRSSYRNLMTAAYLRPKANGKARRSLTEEENRFADEWDRLLKSDPVITRSATLAALPQDLSFLFTP